MNKIALILSLTALIMANTALAGGNPVAGQQKSQVCQACHGQTGDGTDPSYPKLAGQHASYLEKALQDYRSGDRNNPIMASFAQGLSDQDIADLAAFYAGNEGLKDIRIK